LVTYLCLLGTGTCCKTTRTGVRAIEIADKQIRTALTIRCLKLNILVSFLIIPDICRTGRRQYKINSCSPNIGKAKFWISIMDNEKTTTNTMAFDECRIRVFLNRIDPLYLVSGWERAYYILGSIRLAHLEFLDRLLSSLDGFHSPI
jgi:hypothetical protein